MNAPRIARVAVLGGGPASSEKPVDSATADSTAAPDPGDHSPPGSACPSQPSPDSAPPPEPPGRG